MGENVLNPDVDFWDILSIEDKNALLDDQSADFSFRNSFKLKNIMSKVDKEILETKVKEEDSKEIACSLCSYRTKSKGHITKHLKKKHSIRPTQLLVSCNQCSYTTSQPGHLKRHVSAKHTLERFSCEYCEETFSIKHSVRIHQQSVHMQIKYPCPKCTFEGKRLESLKNHMLIKHSSSQFQCLICHLNFKAKLHLKKHMQIDHGGLRFYCKFKSCKYNAKDGSTLRHHLKVEHYNLRYLCNICRNTYSHITSAKNHISDAHPDGDVCNIEMIEKAKRFSCSECGISTSTRNVLNAHIKTEHPELLKVGDIPCSLCTLTTKSKAFMTTHLRLKHGIEPLKEFPCSICDYVAKTVDHLKRHQSLKHLKDVPREKCPFCEATFAVPWSVKKHVKNVHSTKFEIKEEPL